MQKHPVQQPEKGLDYIAKYGSYGIMKKRQEEAVWEL